MSDDELLSFLGFKSEDFTNLEHKSQVLAALSDKRATYERMYLLTLDLALYELGLAPKPTGVLVDWARGPTRARVKATAGRHRATGGATAADRG